MNKRELINRADGVLSVMIGVCLLFVPACRAEAPAMGQQPTSAETSHLDHLAENGHFDEVLNRLKADYPAAQTRPQVKSLVNELQHYDKAHAKLRQQRQDEYASALQKVKQHIDQGDIEEALIAAIDARTLGSEPAKVLQNKAVKQSVRKGKARARAAEKEHDWVRALTLYRALDLLYNDYATFHGDVKRVTRHVEVLQVYAPKRLRALYKAQAARQKQDEEKRNQDKAGGTTKSQSKTEEPSKANGTSHAAGGEQNPEAVKGSAAAELEAAQGKVKPTQIESEPWQVRLRGIDMSMLRQSLAEAARKHVDSRGYLPLVKGAVASLQIMLHTEGLTRAFPAFKDKTKLSSFQDQLTQIQQTLNKPNARLNFLDTASILDRIVKINQRTLQLPKPVLTYELGEGATSTLDQFSTIIWPEEKKRFSRSTQGKFFGVGISISRRNGRLVVVTPLPDTPAQEAGIKADDIIAQVNGTDTSSWSLDKAVREITGPKGTVVKLGIERAGRKKLLQIPLHRAEIEIHSIEGWQHTDSGGWDYWIDPDQRIGYVRLTQFLPQTAEELDKAVAQMQKDGPIHGLIIDLRFDPGGLLSTAVDVVDRFIKKGPIVFTVDADRTKTSVSRAHAQDTYPHFPLVVLVNQGSASASEITAGALQDYGRATIVGTRSFGKGSVQDLFPLDHGKAYFKLTTQYYMLPLGRIIHRRPNSKTWGIQPDLEVDMTNKQVAKAMEYRQKVDVLRDHDGTGEDKNAPTADKILKKGLDPQLSAALLVLQTRLVASDLAAHQARAEASARPTP